MNENRLIFALKGSPHYVTLSNLKNGRLSSVPTDVVALCLERAEINDQDVIEMPYLASLRCLDLDGTRISDLALTKIASLPVLEELWLEETAVTDAGLKVLETAQNLRFVSLAYTSASAEGINSLTNAIPGLVVST